MTAPTARAASPWRYVRLGPGLDAAVRDTPTGEVRMVITGGPLKITEGARQLAMTILDADRRAAQTRSVREKRAARRAAKRGAR